MKGMTISVGGFDGELEVRVTITPKALEPALAAPVAVPAQASNDAPELPPDSEEMGWAGDYALDDDDDPDDAPVLVPGAGRRALEGR